MKKHPEQKNNEIFIINIKDGEKWFEKSDIFKSVRIGKIAYQTGFKNIVPDMKPLFGILNPNRIKK